MCVCMYTFYDNLNFHYLYTNCVFAAGLLLKLPVLDGPGDDDEYFDDTKHWHVADELLNKLNINDANPSTTPM